MTWLLFFLKAKASKTFGYIKKVILVVFDKTCYFNGVAVDARKLAGI